MTEDRLLTPEEINEITKPDAELGTIIPNLLQAQLDKVDKLRAERLDRPELRKIQKLWCQHCKAMQKTNDTVVECWYNPLSEDYKEAFCAASIDAVNELLALLPDVDKVVEGIFELAELILTFAEHGDYSNGVEFYGADEGRVRAGEALDEYREQLQALKASKGRSGKK